MKQEFYELAKKIADWHTVTFKDADKAGQLLKLDEEFDEWMEERKLTELVVCFVCTGFIAKRRAKPNSTK